MNKQDLEFELMICAKEQCYTITLNNKTIGFPLETILDIWDILREEDFKDSKRVVN